MHQLGTTDANACVYNDLALVKVTVAGHDRAHLLRVVDETRAHIVDSSDQTMTLEITGEPPHVDAVITHGGTVVLPAETFDPQACLEAVEREACTLVYLRGVSPEPAAAVLTVDANRSVPASSAIFSGTFQYGANSR